MPVDIEKHLKRAEKFKFEFITGQGVIFRFYYPKEKYHLLRRKIKWFFEEGRKHYVDPMRPILSMKVPGREGYIKMTPVVWSHHSLPEKLNDS